MRPKQGPFQNPSTQKTPFKDDFLQHTNLFNACRVYLNTKFIKILSIQVTDVTAEVSNTRPAMLFGNFQIINIYVAKCLENRCREIIESKLNDTQCGFRPGRGTTDHISFFSKILRNLGGMLKTSSRALLTSRKHTTGFLLKSIVECCLSTVLTAACYWPSSCCIPAQKFMFMSGELNHHRSPLVLDSDNGVCCHRCFS